MTLLSIANTSVVNLAILHSVPKINIKLNVFIKINAPYLYAKYKDMELYYRNIIVIRF